MRKLILTAVVMLATAMPAFGRSDQDRVGVGNEITIAEGETAGDVACAFCSVKVHGDVKGDVAVLFGRISVDANHEIAGDVAGLGTELRLGEEATVGGDVALMAGSANLGSGATIRGSQALMPSRIWLLLPFAPLLILAGVIWLIVWLVRRNRYRVPVYPNVRRF
jgi:hypothetical protein